MTSQPYSAGTLVTGSIRKLGSAPDYTGSSYDLGPYYSILDGVKTNAAIISALDFPNESSDAFKYLYIRGKHSFYYGGSTTLLTGSGQSFTLTYRGGSSYYYIKPLSYCWSLYTVTGTCCFSCACATLLHIDTNSSGSCVVCIVTNGSEQQYATHTNGFAVWGSIPQSSVIVTPFY